MQNITQAPLHDAASGKAELPPRWLMLAEIPRLLGALAELALHTPALARAPRGNGSPVLVIPGFAATDRSTALLRRYLAWLGHDVHGWGLGRNLGAATIGLHNELLLERLDEVHASSGRRLHLIGWSMGGIMARMVARARPDAVEQLIVLGAPFTGDPYANHGWRLYETMTGHSLSHPIARAQIMESRLPTPVRSTSIYSRSDGIVAWQCCLEPPGRHGRNIEVASAHCAFAFNARVLRTIATLLSTHVRDERISS